MLLNFIFLMKQLFRYPQRRTQSEELSSILRKIKEINHGVARAVLNHSELRIYVFLKKKSPKTVSLTLSQKNDSLSYRRSIFLKDVKIKWYRKTTDQLMISGIW